MLFYRAWAREAYTKQAAVNSIEIYREADKNRSLPYQLAMQSFILSYAKGLQAGLADVLYYKGILDAALLAHEYETVRSLIIWFESPPDVLCSGAMYPYWDFEGRELQPQGPRPRPAPLALSLLASPTGSAAIFSWLREFNAPPRAFLASLRRQDRLGDALIRFVFSAFENVFARPSWWESFPEPHRQQLIQLLMGYMNPIVETRSDHLTDDGRRFSAWKFSCMTEA